MCWLRADPDSDLFGMSEDARNILVVGLYNALPAVIILSMICVYYIKGYRKLQKMSKLLFSNQGVDAKRLMIFPLALILCYVPANIDTAIKMITGNSVYALLCLHMGTAHSIGFIDFLIYRIQAR